MSITAAQLIVKVGGDTNDAEGKLRRVNQQVNESSGFFKGALGSALGFIGAQVGMQAFGDAVSFVRDQIGEVFRATNEYDQANAQLASTLKSTGDASGMTMAGLQGIAEQMSSVSDYSKPMLEQSEKVLLTFTNIGSSVFPQASQASADLAARMGMDLNSAALVVGKALGDPVKGVTALRREGVQLSKQQQELVKHMMAVGDTAGAQKVILAELEREMGGAAQAAGSTLGGQLDIAKNKLDDVRAQVGEKLEPELGKLLMKLMPLAEVLLNDLPPAADATINALTGAYNIVKQVLDFIQTHEAVLDLVKGALVGLGVVVLATVIPAFIGWAIAAGAAAVATITATLPIIAIIAAIALLVAGFKLAYDHVTPFRLAVQAMGNDIHLVVDVVGFLIGKLGDLLGLLGKVKDLVTGGLGQIGNVVGNLHIPGFASGTNNAPGGLALVGEQGPELVHLPGGSQVIPNSGLGGGSGGGAQTVVINIDGRKVAEATVKHMPSVIRNATGARSF